jgi:hypothetical protein
MKLLRLIEFLRSRLRAVVIACLVTLAILALLDAIPGVVDKSRAHTAAERLPAFWSVFGFLGCALIVFFSKAFGHAGIVTREEYYDE